MERERAVSHASAFAAVMIWGITFIATKQLLKTFTMSEILVVRFVMGVITLYLLDMKNPRNRFSLKDEVLFALSGAAGVTVYYGVETLSLTMTSASNVGILTSLAPLTTAVAGAFLLKSERLRPSYIWGSLLAFLGVVLVILNGTRFEGFSLRGDLIALERNRRLGDLLSPAQEYRHHEIPPDHLYQEAHHLRPDLPYPLPLLRRLAHPGL